MPEKIEGRAIPLPLDNVDTDQIIPAQFLRLLEKKGLGKYLFYRWRYDERERPKSDFVLNDPRFKDGSVLVAKKNFGIGSSRENAVWALTDYGIRAVIAESFGDIFYGNSIKNGLACIKLDEKTVNEIIEKARDGNLSVTVDLLNKKVIFDGKQVSFEIEEYARRRLMSGQSEIDYTLSHYLDKIEEHEKSMKAFMKTNLSETLKKLIEG
ncbi:MAG: 3-isopropylmalate dehydratase small subunit [Nitrososphaeria archaeon]|nr:3-isopropylmalate dehydratase small subunit [Conexivisphaerales archaeon]